MYRCPDPNGGQDQFTNMAGDEEAKARGCKVIEGAPITVTEGAAAKRAAPANAGDAADAARTCINYWRKVIDRQQRIAKESGFVDKGLMYTAGSRVVDCQDQLKKLEAAAAAAKKK